MSDKYFKALDEVDLSEWRSLYESLPPDSERVRRHWDDEARVLGIQYQLMNLPDLRNCVTGRREALLGEEPAAIE